MEDVRAYAFEPSNPCSSPANATSSTLVWNLMPSSLIRWAIASNETVPEPSSLPPGAYNTAVSLRRSQKRGERMHSRVASQTTHASHSGQRSKRWTASLLCRRIYFTQKTILRQRPRPREQARRVPYQTTLGAKPSKNGLSSHDAPAASNCDLSHAAATREPPANEWRDSIPEAPSSLVR